jgi:hypothetical protein
MDSPQQPTATKNNPNKENLQQQPDQHDRNKVNRGRGLSGTSGPRVQAKDFDFALSDSEKSL